MIVEEMDVFKVAHAVTLAIYKLTEKYPKDEMYGLVSQMRRSVVSINSNLMEGYSRTTRGEAKQFVGIARGSAAELKYQVLVSKDLKLISTEEAKTLRDEIGRVHSMLTGLLKTLK